MRFSKGQTALLLQLKQLLLPFVPLFGNLLFANPHCRKYTSIWAIMKKPTHVCCRIFVSKLLHLADCVWRDNPAIQQRSYGSIRPPPCNTFDAAPRPACVKADVGKQQREFANMCRRDLLRRYCWRACGRWSNELKTKARHFPIPAGLVYPNLKTKL